MSGMTDDRALWLLSAAVNSVTNDQYFPKLREEAEQAHQHIRARLRGDCERTVWGMPIVLDESLAPDELRIVPQPVAGDAIGAARAQLELVDAGEMHTTDLANALRGLYDAALSTQPAPSAPEVADIQVRQYSSRLGRWTDWERVLPEYYERNKNKPGQIEWRFLYSHPAPSEQVAASDITADLDFEPDEYHSIADMANVGYSLMQAIKSHRPEYCWMETPAEIVGDLLNERDEALGVVPGGPEVAASVAVPEGWLLVPREPPQMALDYLKVPALGNWEGMLALMPVPPRAAAPVAPEREG